MVNTQHIISVQEIMKAKQALKGIARHTPLELNDHLSEKYNCNLYLKREDLQVVRSYKIRGAYNKMKSLASEVLAKGVICASAGNHAQGFAYACKKLQVKGKVVMPVTTTQQKISAVQRLGKQYVEIVLQGDTYDDAYYAAIALKEKEGLSFIHPFSDEKIIAGQGTIADEILEDANDIDILLIPVGGGGLSAGVGSYFKQISNNTKIIGVEPAGAPAMQQSLQKGEVVTLTKIDGFVDGAAVREVGHINFEICQNVLDELLLVDEGKICSTILDLYNEAAIVVEPAGAMTIAVLDQIKDKIEGKNVCCIISGGNNDITRMADIKERSMIYEGLKHYFVIRLAQRAGALKEFLANVLGPDDDICFFEYTKKTSRTSGPIVIGIELKDKSDFKPLTIRMEQNGIQYRHLNNSPDLLTFLT